VSASTDRLTVVANLMFGRPVELLIDRPGKEKSQVNISTHSWSDVPRPRSFVVVLGLKLAFEAARVSVRAIRP